MHFSLFLLLYYSQRTHAKVIFNPYGTFFYIKLLRIKLINYTLSTFNGKFNGFTDLHN